MNAADLALLEIRPDLTPREVELIAELRRVQKIVREARRHIEKAEFFFEDDYDYGGYGASQLNDAHHCLSEILGT